MILAPIANADPEGNRFFVAKEPYSSIKETAFYLESVKELEKLMTTSRVSSILLLTPDSSQRI